MKCKLCRREVKDGSDLCIYHAAARDNLYKGYDRWLQAYGELSWKAYLERILNLQEAGAWVREVAKLELEKEGLDGGVKE